MTITFPRAVADFAALLPIKSVVWRVQRADEFAGLGSSETIAIEMASPLWAADVVLDKGKWKEAREFSADVNVLEGSIRHFYLFNPLGRYPAADPTGAILGANVVTLHTISDDRDYVRFTGLPANYVLSKGDFWHVDFSSNPVRRGFFQISETVQASAGGLTPLVRVFPHVWPGITTGLEIVLKEPAAKVTIAPNTLAMGAIRRAMADGSTFSVLQKI